MMNNNEETDPSTPENLENNAEEKPAVFSIIKAVQSVLLAALLVASLFTLFTPANFFSGSILDSMLYAAEDSEKVITASIPTMMASSQRIGIVAGHWKDAKNSGFICGDGLAENTLNLQIATLVAQELTNRGYQVDLLEENDARLNEYRALALVSIHNDTCEFLSNDATGFKVSPALANAYPDEANLLSQCLIDNYGSITGMTFQTNKLTTDMTTYHSFSEVHSSTPTVIIETGYLNLDRQILTQSTDLVVKGIVDGVLCYVEREPGQEATTAP
ncbi:MAG: N-acetylmuramoyl-L-alanine amidase [Chloroflexi bacterium]|nr:N-acetylmuramoyl-L-alanine amidase [Chloroflexota bacterium]